MNTPALAPLAALSPGLGLLVVVLGVLVAGALAFFWVRAARNMSRTLVETAREKARAELQAQSAELDLRLSEAEQQYAHDAAERERRHASDKAALLKAIMELRREVQKLAAERDTALAGREQAATAAAAAAAAERDRLTSDRQRLLADRQRLLSDRQRLLADRQHLVADRDQAKADRDEAKAERDRLAAERDGIAAERDRIAAERDGFAAEREGVSAGRDDLATQRDSLVSERDNLAAERDKVAFERDHLAAERDRVAAERDSLAADRDRLAAELAHVTTDRDRIAAERDGIVAERDSIAAERDRATAERDRVATERDPIQIEHDRVLSERDGLIAERNAALAERERLAAERDALVAERDRLAEERNGVVAERDRVAEERDNVVAERDRVVAERDRVVAEHDRLAAERNHLAAELDRVTAERESLASERDRLAAERGDLAAARDQFAAERERQAAELAAARTQLEKMRSFDGRLWERDPPAEPPAFVPRERRKTVFIAVANLKGGVGKTTIASNVGMALAHRGKRVLMVDLDFQGSLTRLCTDFSTLKDLVRRKDTARALFDLHSAPPEEFKERLDRLVRRVAGSTAALNVGGGAAGGDPGSASHYSGGPAAGSCDFIAAYDDLAEAELREEARWFAAGEPDVRFSFRRVFHSPAILERYDYVLFDCPPRLTAAAVNALGCSDWLLVPVVLEEPAVQAVPRTLAWLRGLSRVSPARLMGVVANQAHFRGGELVGQERTIYNYLPEFLRRAGYDMNGAFRATVKSDAATIARAANAGRIAAADRRALPLFTKLVDEIERTAGQ